MVVLRTTATFITAQVAKAVFPAGIGGGAGPIGAGPSRSDGFGRTDAPGPGFVVVVAAGGRMCMRNRHFSFPGRTRAAKLGGTDGSFSATATVVGALFEDGKQRRRLHLHGPFFKVEEVY